MVGIRERKFRILRIDRCSKCSGLLIIRHLYGYVIGGRILSCYIVGQILRILCQRQCKCVLAVLIQQIRYIDISCRCLFFSRINSKVDRVERDFSFCVVRLLLIYALAGQGEGELSLFQIPSVQRLRRFNIYRCFRIVYVDKLICRSRCRRTGRFKFTCLDDTS